MNFLNVLIWIVIIFVGSLLVQFNIFLAIDTYFSCKEKHMQKVLDVFSEAIKKVSEKKEKE